jgi:ADP-heptose:LPS heptosyltransferase
MRPLDAERPAVLFCNAVGDHLLALPTLRALAATFPERLTLVCRSGARRSFFTDLEVHRVVEVAMAQSGHRRRTWYFDADEVARKLSGCDLFLSLNPWHSGSLDRLLKRLAPLESFGFSRAFRREIPLDFSKHSADLVFDLARRLNRRLRIEDFGAAPSVSAGARRWARGVRAALPRGTRILAIHADTKPEKMWPLRRWIALLDEFLRRHPDFVAFDVGYHNHRLDVGIERDRVIPCARLSLPAAFALVAEADLFLGVDSSFLHAADLFRVAGVGLFGPTAPSEWGFRFARHRHVRGKTMGRISVPRVLEAVEDLVRRPPATRDVGR